MFKRFLRLAVYVPAMAATGEPEKTFESTSAVHTLLSVFRQFDFVGKVGTYKTVVEISNGTETFAPTMNSRPTYGAANVASTVPSVKLVTYMPAGTHSAEVDRMIAEVVLAHPWEHPVIELNPVYLWMPS